MSKGRRFKAQASGAALVLLAGCPPEPEPPASSCPVALTIGDGESPFRAREPREEALIVHGPQGGFHIEVSLWGSGLSSPWEIAITARYGETNAIVSEQFLSLSPSPVPDDPCAMILPRALAVFDVHELTNDTPAELLAGQMILIEAIVTDSDGITSSSEVEVIGATLEE